MSNLHRAPTAVVIVAAVVAIALGAGILALALIDPLALVGLAPVLFAVAAIVRAVTGARPDRSR